MNEVTILPSKTITGNGSIFNLFEIAKGFGENGLVVTDPSFARNGYLDTLKKKQPRDMKITYFQYAGNGEPTLSHLKELKEFTEKSNIDWVAGIGGGSVLDLSKTATGLAGANRPVIDYHNRLDLFASGIPFIAASTTAGTGSEVTAGSVFTNEETLQKKPIINELQRARVVIIDSEMLAKCPRTIIAASGLDALTQSIEAYTSNVTTPLTDAIAMTSIKYIIDSLEDVYNGYTKDKAEMLLTGSYLSGIALSNAKLGIVHGIAHPLGSRTHAPHGLLCGVLLPYAIELNRSAIGEKYDELSKVAGKDIIEYVNELLTKFDLTYEVSIDIIDDIDAIIAETQSGATKFNPRPVSSEEIVTLIKKFIN